jgi:pentatricopeptide repeat protein
MFDVDLIVLKKVVVYVRREIGVARGLAEEGEWEEVMRVYSRLRSGLIRQ